MRFFMEEKTFLSSVIINTFAADDLAPCIAGAPLSMIFI